MKKVLVIFFLVSVWVVHAAPSEIVGQVVFVHGGVTAINGQGQPRVLNQDAPVLEGDRIEVGAQAHLHLRMVDDAFVALRPSSHLWIAAYRYDPQHPERSQIRLDLSQGTGRVVSGKGGEAAKHQYRFNTPLAAIGLRGTDYTVDTREGLTRVRVDEGAVAVSPFGPNCSSDQLGPCATPQTLELTAAMNNMVIEVKPDQAPRLAPSPAETSSQQKTDETTAQTEPLLLGQEAAVQDGPATLDALLQPAVRATPEAAAEPLARWGRWSALVKQWPDGAPSINDVFASIPDYRIVAANAAFALAYPGAESSRLPQGGTGPVSFELGAAEAYVKSGERFAPASVQGGSLSINFAQQSFATQLNVQTPQDGMQSIQAAGTVDRYGRMQADPAASNAELRGVVLNQGREASYLVDKALPAERVLSGAAWWSR
jgi:hypothetical protein